MVPIDVLVADDHPLFREGLARIVRSDARFALVGEAVDGREALAMLHEHRPALALVDLRLPGLDGIEVVAAAIRDRLPTRILIVSAFDDAELVYRSLEAGAGGYITKDSRREQIVDALARIADGETVIAGTVSAGLATQIRLRAQPAGPALTGREREVLVLLAKGRTAPDIARELVLGVTTIKTHLAHLYDKLGVGDRAAAVAEAMRRGLIE